MRQGKIIAVAAALVMLFCLMLNAVARAQQITPFDAQAAQQELMTVLGNNLQLRAALLSAQDQLAKAQAEINRLNDAKKDEDKK